MRNLQVSHPGFAVPELLDPDEIAQAKTTLSIKHNAQMVLHIGTLQPRKNIGRLLQAFAQILAETRGDRPVLVLAGKPGWGGENYAQMAQKLGIAAHVRITGYLDEKTKTALLRGARVLAFPSLHEGFGFPLLEAQSVDVPVLCSNTSSLPEVAGDGAVLINPTDVTDLACGLRATLDNEALRAQLIERGRRNTLRFSWAACAKTILSAIEEKTTQKQARTGSNP